MGSMRFLVQHSDQIAEGVLARIYMNGIDGIPWRSRVSWEDEQLVIERHLDDSGNVHVPWKMADGIEWTLSTASLMERDRPYLLEVELARGTINLVRNQISAWQLAGLLVPAEIKERLAQANHHFALAATSQNDPPTAAQHAAQSIEVAVEVVGMVGRSYTQQAMAARRRQTPKLPTLMGINLGSSVIQEPTGAALAKTFSTAVVPVGWRQTESGEGKRSWDIPDAQIQWAQQNGMRICAGPLLQLDPSGIPDWTYLWEGDFENLLSFMLEHVKAVVTRYSGKVNLWQVAGRISAGDALSLDEEQRLRIVVRAIEAVRQIDARTPLVVNFDQPWGEYLAHQDMDLTPMHFADTLIRAELGLAGLGLEINAGYSPDGTLLYSMLDYSQLLDRWSMLGLPLLVNLTTPSSGAEDPLATSKSLPLPRHAPELLSLDSQREWIEGFIPLMLSKNCVQVVAWNQLHDSQAHDFPHGGLYDRTGQPKPALDALHEIRREYLN